MRSIPWKPVLWGAGGALGGLVIGLSLWHLWVDHLALHEIQTFLQQYAGRIAKLP